MFDKFQGADFKHDNSFLKLYSKNTQLRFFFVFLQNLQLDKFKGADFKYDNSFFKNFSPKIPKYVIFCSKFKDFHFCSNICNKANLRVLISNMTVFFQNSSQNTQLRHYWFQILKIFIFEPNFAIRQIQGH